MSLPLKTGLPVGLEVSGDYIMRWRATDPTTGADVSGVVVSNVSVYGTPLTGTPSESLGGYELIPGPESGG